MKTKISKIIALGGMILGLTGIANAATSVNFTETFNQTLTASGANSGGSLSMISGGMYVAETAFWANVNNSTSTVTGTSSTFARTWLGSYGSAGAGVCNPNEQSVCTNDSQHQIDNYVGLDFINLSFAVSVNLNDIKVANYGGVGTDIDLSYAILTQAQETALNAGTLVFSTVTFSTLSSASAVSGDYSGLNINAQYLLIGAAVTANRGGDSAIDAFKLQTVSGSYATPEPASFVMIGSGLLGAAFLRRRKMAKANS